MNNLARPSPVGPQERVIGMECAVQRVIGSRILTHPATERPWELAETLLQSGGCWPIQGYVPSGQEKSRTKENGGPGHRQRTRQDRRPGIVRPSRGWHGPPTFRPGESPSPGEERNIADHGHEHPLQNMEWSMDVATDLQVGQDSDERDTKAVAENRDHDAERQENDPAAQLPETEIGERETDCDHGDQ